MRMRFIESEKYWNNSRIFVDRKTVIMIIVEGKEMTRKFISNRSSFAICRIHRIPTRGERKKKRSMLADLIQGDNPSDKSRKLKTIFLVLSSWTGFHLEHRFMDSPPSAKSVWNVNEVHNLFREVNLYLTRWEQTRFFSPRFRVRTICFRFSLTKYYSTYSVRFSIAYL